MSRSEFRWNKRRKHYAYLFKNKGLFILNIVITTKPVRVSHGKIKQNIKLYHHPNPAIGVDSYLIPLIYFDRLDSFGVRIYRWTFDKNDKRKVKRIKKRYKKKK